MGIGDTSAYLGFSLLKNSAPISKTLKTPNLEKFSKLFKKYKKLKEEYINLRILNKKIDKDKKKSQQ